MQRPIPVHMPHTPGWVGEFKKFIMRGNVVDLAVGIIIGAAFTSVVNSLVKDVFTPVLGLLVGGVDFSNWFVTLKGPHENSLSAAQAAGATTINVGLFLNAIISFLVVSFAVFWVVKALSRFKAKEEEKPVALTKSEELLTEIRDLIATERREGALTRT